jgi:hypothetical protein
LLLLGDTGLLGSCNRIIRLYPQSLDVISVCWHSILKAFITIIVYYCYPLNSRVRQACLGANVICLNWGEDIITHGSGRAGLGGGIDWTREGREIAASEKLELRNSKPADSIISE